MTSKELAAYYRKHKSRAQKVDVMIARLIMGFFVLMVCVEFMR